MVKFLCADCQISFKTQGNTVKPRFSGPLGGKELSPVDRDARYVGVHFTLIYTQSLFSGIELRPGILRDPVNRGTVNQGFTVRS